MKASPTIMKLARMTRVVIKVYGEGGAYIT